MNKRMLLAFPLFGFISIGWGQNFTLNSPDNSIAATISIVNGNLNYSLDRSGTTDINTSRLGLVIQQGGGSVDLGAGITGSSASPITSFDQTYNVIGWHNTAENHYNTFTLNVQSGSLSSAVEFRAYNDGFAFRYDNVPGSGSTTVLGESTQWSMSGTMNGNTVNGWYQAGANKDYSNNWVNNPLSTMSSAGTVLGPVVMNFGAGNGYAALNESGDWAWTGMSYHGAGSNSNTLRAVFPRVPVGRTGWQVAAGSNSPWRTITLSGSLNGLVNSDMMTNTAPPPDPMLYPQGVNTSWITPGRATWLWLDDESGGGITPQKIETYIDESAKLGFEYTTIDNGWQTWADFQHAGEGSFDVLKDVVDYAHSKGVKVLVWKDSNDFYSYPAGSDSTTGTFDYGAMQSYLQTLHDLGLDGIKMDALAKPNHLVGEYQKMLNFMAATYQDASVLHMVVDEHGAPKDSGANYTYPNALTTEDIKGLEHLADPAQEATLPFTTLLGGPADYTPGLFTSAANPRNRGNTTWANQMAMGILITSPLMHWASDPISISNAMPDGSDQLQVFEDISSTWDETRVLDISQIGKIAAFARRKGNTWFLAIVNGDPTNPLTLDHLDLSFLGNDEYKAILLADDPNETAAWAVSDIALLNESYNLDVILDGGGGFVAEFTLIPEPTAVAAMGLFCIILRRSPRRRGC